MASSEGRRVPATAERLPAKYLVKEEAPKIISSAQQHEAYIPAFSICGANRIAVQKKRKRPNCSSF